MNKKFGFTLAEVLITLGIIGVVAAMTIPTLIANTNAAKFRSQFKKAVSTLNQAGLMAQAQYDIDYSTRSVIPESGDHICDTDSDPSNGNYSICAIFNGTLTVHDMTTTSPYAQEPTGAGDSNKVLGEPTTNKTYMSLADGSLVVFSSSAINCTKPIGSTISAVPVNCRGFIDVNGKTLPNKEVTCSKAGSTTSIGEGVCEVASDANHMTDVYPIIFHDATVEPLTNAARYVLTTSK